MEQTDTNSKENLGIPSGSIEGRVYVYTDQPNKVEIKPEALRLMIQEAESAFPNECCGFFFGEESREKRIVNEAIPAGNQAGNNSRRRFEITPAEYMAAERHAAKENTNLIGIYHSHPNYLPLPSEHDLKQAMPWFSYFILSVWQGEYRDIRSWQLNDQGLFTEEKLIYQPI